jgi:hypothetical protein
VVESPLKVSNILDSNNSLPILLYKLIKYSYIDTIYSYKRIEGKERGSKEDLA